MEYLVVRNWEEFQHYKDRNPPWIKLHRALLDNYEFCALKDIHKAHLVLIWILASQNDGKVPNDPGFLEKKLSCSNLDVEVLVQSGFLIVEQDASKALAGRKQDATELLRLEEKRREEKRIAQAFENFYAAYPKKKSRGDAEKAWKAISPDEHLADTILQAVQRAKTSEQWLKNGGQFIPYPATWLRDKAWMDEVAPRLATVGGTVDPRFKGAK